MALPGGAAFEIYTPDRVYHLQTEHANVTEAHKYANLSFQTDYTLVIVGEALCVIHSSAVQGGKVVGYVYMRVFCVYVKMSRNSDRSAVGSKHSSCSMFRLHRKTLLGSQCANV